jgi:hypothetical protein
LEAPGSEKPVLASCPVRTTAQSKRSDKAPEVKVLKEGKPQPDESKGAAGSKKTKLINNDGLAESTRDQMPADQHEPSPSLA